MKNQVHFDTNNPPTVGVFDPSKILINKVCSLKFMSWWKRLMRSDGYCRDHPAECLEILNGIKNGVDIEFNDINRYINRSSINHRSALSHKQKVGEGIAKDVLSHKKLGPFNSPPYKFFSVSPLGAVVKRGSEKVRAVHDLSNPDLAADNGESINGNITTVGMELGKFDDAITEVIKQGKGCLLTKLDVDAAYKQVPVRKLDWSLLGFTWEDKYYIDITLPFGLKSSCRKWDLYASALEYLIKHDLGINFVIHYVDDFLIVSAPLSPASHHLNKINSLCEELGMPMKPEKTVGPCTKLTFLGIEIDTIAMEIRLDYERLTNMRADLSLWCKAETLSLKECQSIRGILNFATKVIPAGKAFLRRLTNHITKLSTKVREGKNSLIKQVLPSYAKADLLWWQKVLTDYNGITLLPELTWLSMKGFSLSTDACQSGYGAQWGSHWIAGKWDATRLEEAQRDKTLSMPYLEMYALLLAAQTWGPLWGRRKINFHCDCQPIVHGIINLDSRAPTIQRLFRRLVKISIECNFRFVVHHIAGVNNVAADHLSRDDLSSFFQVLREAGQEPDPLVYPHQWIPQIKETDPW